jgi:beta-fructofuranosidase
MTRVFYTPQNAAVGDVIPFFADDEFKIFYLQLSRQPENPEPMPPWYLLGSRDFHQYKDYGPCGISGGTGTVLEANGIYHMFYCVFPEGQQVIAHATSSDLLAWEKHPEDDFLADPVFYTPTDWRDPFVFWNEEASEFWMLVSARTKSQYNRNGCAGLCVSSDLRTWQTRPPLFAPDLYISALECPDLFRMGEWWYLVYSTYNDRFATHYRMSRSPSGPWNTPKVDTFDGRAYYAAKTCTDGNRRFLFGWNPTRTENTYHWNPPAYDGKDFNTWDWGGNLIVHQIEQQADGTLTVLLPESVANIFQQSESIELQADLGMWKRVSGGYSVSSPNGFACAISETLPSSCLVSVTMQYISGTQRLGAIIRANQSLDKGYFFQIEPHRNRIVFKPSVFTDEHGGKIPPHEVDLERPLALSSDQVISIKFVIDGSICEVYIDEQVAMSTRIYDLEDGSLGLYVVNGEATFTNIEIKTTR